ncbi:MAG: hypothetical protein K0U47_05760 [Epsilonproteobacteria bacterium]|nr:hypothetical protein [Campylobacterota bacterium]
MKYFMAGFLIIIVLLEVILRLAFQVDQEVLYIESKEYEYLYQPNQNIKRFGNTFMTNTYAMRSGTIREDAKKILFFGDSVLTGGILSSHADLATTQLQIYLEKELKSKVDILNIASPSWGVDNAFAYLKEYGDFNASAIVLVYSSHDAYDTMTFQKIVGKHPRYPVVQPCCALHSIYRRYILPRISSLFHSQNRDKNTLLQITEAPSFSSGWKNFIIYCQKYKIPLLVVLHPTIDEIEADSYNKNGLEIIHLLQQYQVEYVKELDFKPSTSYYRKDGMGIHYNNEGQEFLLKLLKPLVLDKVK